MNDNPQTAAISQRAEFEKIRYANVWEDADILCEALQIGEHGHYLSIASGGDNCLAMLAFGAKKVTALDLSQSQLYCLEIKVAAYREFDYSTLLQFLGVNTCSNRIELFERLLPHISKHCFIYWQQHIDVIAQGLAHAGKFEKYFAIFRHYVLPLVHSKKRVKQLLSHKSLPEQVQFYQHTWNTWRWRLMYRMFFSRRVMGWLGRDPAFFDYVDTPVASRLLARTEFALTKLDTAHNPYLNKILTGTYGDSLPLYLRPAHYARIKANLHRLEWHKLSIEEYIVQQPDTLFAGANLSDIFEYMSQEQCNAILKGLHSHCAPGARLVYWNMLAPRQRPDSMAAQIASLTSLSDALFSRDNAFFYSRFIVEEIIK